MTTGPAIRTNASMVNWAINTQLMSLKKPRLRLKANKSIFLLSSRIDRINFDRETENLLIRFYWGELNLGKSIQTSQKCLKLLFSTTGVNDEQHCSSSVGLKQSAHPVRVMTIRKCRDRHLFYQESGSKHPLAVKLIKDPICEDLPFNRLRCSIKT